MSSNCTAWSGMHGDYCTWSTIMIKWALSNSCETFTNESQLYTGINPIQQTAIVEKIVHFSNFLLVHFHYLPRGLCFLALDWNDEKQKKLVFYGTTIIESPQLLQLYRMILSICVQVQIPSRVADYPKTKKRMWL